MEDKTLTAAKPLPRKADGKIEDTFWANGNLYRWLDISEVGIVAWTALTNLMDVFYSGQDNLKAVQEYHLKTAVDAMAFNDINKLKHFVSTRQQNYLDGIVNKSQARYHLSMHIAAILTLRDGDDIREYSPERADSYVDDWVAEGYSHIDFFSIAGSLSEEFRKSFRQTQARILEAEKATKGGTSTKERLAEL